MIDTLRHLFDREPKQQARPLQTETPAAVVSLRGLACTLDEKSNKYEIDLDKIERLPEDQREKLSRDLWQVVIGNNFMPINGADEAIKGIHALRK